MANLKEVRERIASVKNTQQITKAMKMVSAAKLRRAQTAITEMRPYADKLNQMLRNILSNLDGSADTTFGEEREVKNVAVVVVTSNRGLCGAFNSNIIKATLRMIREDFSQHLEDGRLTLIPIGKKGYDFFRKGHPEIPMNTDYVTLFDDLSFENVSVVSQLLMDGFEGGTYDKVMVAYARFRNAAVQYHEAVQFLPVVKLETEEEETKAHRADYIFEPNQESLLEYLVPSILQTTFHKYLLDTHASEHGARMTAMDAATENANELLNDLKIAYNKARQEAITSEISEIVGGAAALESA
ncbi:MAG: ATP synthase F1 subunit gamma [Bacteroidota bacterium]